MPHILVTTFGGNYVDTQGDDRQQCKVNPPDQPFTYTAFDSIILQTNLLPLEHGSLRKRFALYPLPLALSVPLDYSAPPLPFKIATLAQPSGLTAHRDV